MINRILLFLLIIAISCSAIKAQERDSMIVKKVFIHGLNDTRDWVLSPAKWSGCDWLVFGGLTAVTGALIAWGDKPVYDLSNSMHTPFLDQISPFVEPIGNYYLMAAISGTCIYGLVSKNNYTLETSLIAGESLLLNTLLVQVVKNTLCRVRPNNEGTSNPHQWNGPFFKGNSFFSGHTSSAFSVASVYAYRYRDTGWVPVVSYGVASLVGLQRIYSNRHWASDVLFGAVAGTATGIFLCRQWENNKIRFYPGLMPDGASLSVIIPINSEGY